MPRYRGIAGATKLEDADINIIDIYHFCAGCSKEFSLEDETRSMYIISIDLFMVCHDDRQCLIKAVNNIEHEIGRLEAKGLVQWYLTAKQREQRHLS